MPVSNLNLGIQVFFVITAFSFWTTILINPTFGLDSISDQILPKTVNILLICWNILLFIGIIIYKLVPGRPRTWIIFEIIFLAFSIALEHFTTQSTNCYSSAKHFFTYPCASWTTGIFLISFQITMIVIMIVEEYYCIKRKYI